jgi:hypothetical protein
MNAKRNSDTGATSHGILHLLSQGAVCPQSATYVSSTSVTHVIATDTPGFRWAVQESESIWTFCCPTLKR